MSDDTKLQIERVIDAPPEAVSRAWTTPALMERWYQAGFRRPADLEVGRVPALGRVDDVDHERDTRSLLHVLELLRLPHAHATDVDRAVGPDEVGHRRVADDAIG